MRAPVLCVPLVALLPLQPPVAVHEVALVELHVSVELPPLAITVGFAVNDARYDGPECLEPAIESAQAALF